MKSLSWKYWRISSRIILITVLPVSFMFVAVLTYSYLSRYDEIRQDIKERGELIASGLAESSQYSVISGNLTFIHRNLRGLMGIDKGIAKIEILDPDRKTLIENVSASLVTDSLFVFEVPITNEVINVNTFGPSEGPHVAEIAAPAPLASLVETIGYVRVSMSPEPMLAKKRTRLLVGSSIAVFAFLISSVLGLFLATALTRPLAKTITALRTVREGRYTVELEITDGGEIGELQSSIIEMTKSLNHFKLDMENKVRQRTNELRRARDEAVKADADKRRLIQKVTSALEEERKNISVEIHDHMNGLTIAARLEAQRILDIANLTQPQATGTDDDNNTKLEEIKLRAKKLIQINLKLYAIARDIVKRMRPEVIDTLGLRDAIEEMVQHYDSVHSTCRYFFKSSGDFSQISGSLAISVFRLVQEALSNAIKHAEATSCTVWLFADEKINELLIKVFDDGKGFDPAITEPGVGLLGMKERVLGAGGSLDINAKPHSGTAVTIRLPIVPTIKT